MTKEQKRILTMLSEGQITVDEAGKMLFVLNKGEFGSFVSNVRYLRKHLSPINPCGGVFKVAVNRVDKLDEPDDKADCCFDKPKRRFTIRILKRLSTDAAVLILLHEWAHAMSWFYGEHPETMDHGGAFGHAYSVVWRVFIGDISKAKKKKKKEKDN